MVRAEVAIEIVMVMSVKEAEDLADHLGQESADHKTHPHWEALDAALTQAEDMKVT